MSRDRRWRREIAEHQVNRMTTSIMERWLGAWTIYAGSRYTKPHSVDERAVYYIDDYEDFINYVKFTIRRGRPFGCHTRTWRRKSRRYGKPVAALTMQEKKATGRGAAGLLDIDHPKPIKCKYLRFHGP